MSAFDADIVLVGGGPAGTSTALHLTRVHGFAPGRIVMLEKATHPREKPCAGAISRWGLAGMAAIGVPLEVPHVPMEGLRVLVGSESGAIVRPLGAVVRRDQYDASLWRRALAEGVRGHQGEAVVGLTRLEGGFEVRTPARVVRTRYLAACDGAGSSVRKLLCLKETSRKGHLYVLETPENEGDRGPRAGVCDFDLSPSDQGIEGYYWDFPAVMGGERAVSRGIYHANLTARRDVKEALGRALVWRGLDLAKVTLKPFSTRAFGPESVLALERVILVGEAAGIDAMTGEGIAQALLFGGLAAKHLARAARSGDATFGGYAEEVTRGRMGRHLLQAARLAPVVYGRHGAAARLLLLRSRAARAAAAEWYEGAALSPAAKGAVALTLLRDALARGPSLIAAARRGG